MLFLFTPAWKILPMRTQLNLALTSVGVTDFYFIHLTCGKDGVSSWTSGFVLDCAELIFMKCLSSLLRLKESEYRYTIKTSWVSHSRHTTTNQVEPSQLTLQWPGQIQMEPKRTRISPVAELLLNYICTMLVQMTISCTSSSCQNHRKPRFQWKKMGFLP